MGEHPVTTADVADEVVDTVAVDVSVLGTGSIAPGATEDLPGVGVEVTVSEGWSDEMISTEVAHHVLGLGVVGVIPEVGVSGDSTLAPVGTVVDGWAPGISSRESGPMSASGIVTGDISLVVTVDVGP